MSKPNPTLPHLSRQDIQRFYSGVNRAEGQGPQGECWEWERACIGGYGAIKISNHVLGVRQMVKCHRLAYFLATGQNIGDVLICHRCDNPPCCRPSHLFKGTNKINMQDAAKKGRMATGDRSGARLYPERLARGDDHYLRKDPVKRAIAITRLRTIPRANGERQHSSKLTAALVLEIRQRYSSGATVMVLAREYGLSWPAMNKVIKRVSWKHV